MVGLSKLRLLFIRTDATPTHHFHPSALTNVIPMMSAAKLPSVHHSYQPMVQQ